MIKLLSKSLFQLIGPGSQNVVLVVSPVPLISNPHADLLFWNMEKEDLTNNR